MGESPTNMHIHSLSSSKNYKKSEASGGEGNKNFEKVLRKGEREEHSPSDDQKIAHQDKDAIKSTEEIKEKKTVSLFDLAAPGQKIGVPAKTSLIGETLPDSIEEKSLSALFKGYGTKEKLLAMQEEILAKQANKEHLNTEFSNSIRADTTLEKKGIQPLKEGEITALPQTEIIEGVSPLQSGRAGTRIKELQAIAEQLIDKLYTVSQKGQTDTTISLQHPPLFKGARVVISSFQSAKGEFNVEFSGLTQAGKQLLDFPGAQDSLRLALEQKGYTLHIMTTSTWESTSHSEIESGLAKRSRQDQSDKEQQQKKQG